MSTPSYRTILGDRFPEDLVIRLGDRELVYRKRTWRIVDPQTGAAAERGLRYGENPDQEAALYELIDGTMNTDDEGWVRPGYGLVSALREEDLLQFGKHPGKINLTDLDRALGILRYLMAQPAAVIMKHNNPCGAAWAETVVEAYEKADHADMLAAFGGCAVMNRPVGRDLAERIAQRYLEVVAAPAFEDGAFEILAKRKNLRVVRMERIADLAAFAELRTLEMTSLIDGGLVLQQSARNRVRTPADLVPATARREGKEICCSREPTARELHDLVFGWAVELGVSSNSVLFVKDGATVAIGTGEQDRVGVVQTTVAKAYTKLADRLAREQLGLPYNELELEIERGKRPASEREAIDERVQSARGGLDGAVMVSDGFFPFRDGVDAALRHGVTAIAQPGGSIRDAEVIEACNEAGAAMVFTGQRAFRH
jgi:phosphoribosylaminoimidazolecarboxamide formyltransferase/IMP cyclohydrolase